jgi:hypothetical protein
MDGTPTRRVAMTWRDKDVLLYGRVSAWRDGEVFFHVDVSCPHVAATKLKAEVETFEKGLSFSAPLGNFLQTRGA